MEKIESKRIVLRDFEQDDFNDFWELSKNWKDAPGPDFDKFPVDESGCKEMLEFLCSNKLTESIGFPVQKHNFCAIYLKDEKKVIGLLAINPTNDYFLERKMVDLGHIFHSSYQDNIIDLEAIKTMVDFIFSEITDVKTIVTNNDPNEKQNAPLFSLGFTRGDEEEWDMKLEKSDWKNS